MDRPRIALLNASFAASTTRNFRRELDGSIAEFDVTQDQLPGDVSFDGMIVTGSRASVYWDEPWIDRTKETVEAFIEAGVPTLGICWGHQLLADVLGGAVVDMGTYEIGYREIVRRGEDDLLAGLDERFVAFTTHSDEVVELPPGTRLIADNDVSIQGFTGDGVWGVQFHPEYDMETAREVTLEKDDLDEARKQRALESITEENYRKAGQAKQVFDNFLQLVQRRDTPLHR